MTPMVFCASFVPCARDIRDAVATWPLRKPLCLRSSATGAAMRYTSQVPVADTIAAMTGERTAGTIILESTPIHCTPSKPMATSAEPIRPPNSACDEEEGRPSSQVSTFQRMPPTRPVKTMSISAGPSEVTSIRSRFTMPLPTERATSTERKAPTRFRDAERATAVFGFNAPVAMDVAIALPVS